MEGEVENSLKIYENEIQGGKGLRLGVSMDAPINVPSLRLNPIMITLIGS
jgi:hypothetical protein